MRITRPNAASYRICTPIVFGSRVKIRLVSSAGTGHFYTTTKNKKNQPGKMEIKKFDPKIRKHVMYKEAKIK